MPSLVKMPRIRRPPGAPRIKKQPKFEGPKPTKPEAVTANMTDRAKRAYYALCGDTVERERIVNKFTFLLHEYTTMTLPEAIVYILLEDREIPFSYQSSMLGGRSELGGAVTDFVVKLGGYALAVMVQGDYWHTLPSQVAADIMTKERVEGQYFEGDLITQALEVWESTLLSCDRERCIDQMLTGIEVGRTA